MTTLSREPLSGADRVKSLPPCLYCAGNAYETLFAEVQDRLRHVAGRWSFCRCLGCGSAMLSPFPAAVELPAFYPPVYCFNRNLGGEDFCRRLTNGLDYRFFFGPYYAAQARCVVSRAGRGPGRLLDLGCGNGFLLRALGKHGFTLQGLDFSTKAAHVSERLGIPTVCADVHDLSTAFPPASFEVITAFHLLEHLADVRSVVQSCFALLKPGGWFVAATPLVNSFQARLFRSRWVAATEAPRHVTIPSWKGLRLACEAAGFEYVGSCSDSLLCCAGAFVLSLVPGATTGNVYGGAGLSGIAARLLAGALMPAAMAWCCLVENALLRRPSAGIVFARKPQSG